jgi:hypothetical protein
MSLVSRKDVLAIVAIVDIALLRAAVRLRPRH